ncbi:MAG: YeeE/YedE family protein [Sedimentisphaerales bacterium]|nr:YeeE/YedE family protein [Sedimentisphaerales bacterium]
MKKPDSQTYPLPWWAAGILLGLVQILAVSLAQSLDVWPQFVFTNTKILKSYAPEYIENHPLTNNEEFEKTNKGWWLGIGIAFGACIASLYLKTWKVSTTSDLWQQNYKTPIVVRLIVCFFGGFLMLLGAAIAYGGPGEHFITGLSKLSLAAIPFTLAMLASGMLIAYLIYPVTSFKNNNGN